MNPSRRPGHRGGAAIETAVCLPVLLLMVFGSIECSSMIFLQQTLTVSSYEGARTAIQFDSTNSQVTTKCNDILSTRKVTGGSITLNPPDVSRVPRGSRITVRVSAPCSANSFLPYLFFKGKNLSGTCTMVKE